MAKVYRVQVTEIDKDTNEETQVVEVTLEGFLLSGDCGGGKMCEIIVHDTLASMASRLANGSKTRTAVRLANLFLKVKEDDMENAENALMRAIMGDE